MFDGIKALRRTMALEEAFEKLTRDFRHIEAEWLDTLDRNKRIMGRIAKRAQIDEAPAKDVENGGADPQADFLSRLDPYSRRIWKRRIAAGIRPPGG
jgi:hypothetical protein